MKKIRQWLSNRRDRKPRLEIAKLYAQVYNAQDIDYFLKYIAPCIKERESFITSAKSRKEQRERLYLIGDTLGCVKVWDVLYTYVKTGEFPTQDGLCQDFLTQKEKAD